MKKLGNRVKVSIATTLTGTVTFGAAATAAFLTPTEAGLADGDVVSYILIEGTNVELGIGTIGGSVTTMTRDTVRVSKISGTAGTSKISLGGTATLFIAPATEDLKFQETHGADIVAASTIDLESATGELVDVTGSTGITAITLGEGHERTVRFTGTPAVTNGASLVIPGGTRTAAAGDYAVFRGYAAGVVRCVLWSPASGKAVVPPAFSDVTSTPTTLAGYGITDALPSSYLDTDNTFAANSDVKIPSQKAVKANTAAQIAAYVAAQDVEVLKGAIDCSANPNYPAADAGNVYRVSVAGKIGGASGVIVEVGDRLECFVDSTASGTQAGVGANWIVTQTNIDGFATVVQDQIHAATGKTTPVDADEIGLIDSAASNVIKKLTWANLKATLIGTALTWTGIQTITNSCLKILGSSTGSTTFTSDNAGATNYTLHLPAANSTLLSDAGAVAPGTSGNVLTSNGSIWQSTAPASTGAAYSIAAQTTIAGSPTTLVYTGLTGEDILIDCAGVQQSSGGSLSLRLSLSVNNGSTYQGMGQFSSSFTTATAKSASAFLTGLKLGNVFALGGTIFGSATTGFNGSPLQGRLALAGPVNAIKIEWSDQATAFDNVGVVTIQQR